MSDEKLVDRLKSVENTLKEKIVTRKTFAEMTPQILVMLFTGILIVLKSLGMISLSWWWITIFLWLPLAIFGCSVGIMLVALVFVMVFGSLVVIIDHIYEKFKKRN